MDTWVLLADTRKKMLWMWIGSTAVIMGLILFMTISGATEGGTLAMWLWAFLTLVPTLILLFIGNILNPQPSKVIKKTTFQLVFYGSLAYLLLVLVTLLGMEAWIDYYTEGGIPDYFKQSYLWLLPFEFLLIVGVWILYFQKTKLLQPNEKILLEYAQKKADFANRYGSYPQKQAFELLLKNEMEGVFDHLEKNLTNKEDANTALILKSQFTTINEQLGFDTTDPEEAQRELNRITLALINIFENL